MSYIGAEPAEKYISLETQNFTVSATTSYTLANSVTNENEIALFINNVRQQPGSSYAYTASGTTLTLSSATAGTDTMFCVYLGKAVGTINPPDGSVGDSTITAMSASKLTGTIADARFPATLPAVSGANLTNLPITDEITKSTSEPAGDTNPSGGVGSLWLRTTTGEMYCLTDATTDANVWTNIGEGTGNQPFIYMTATGGTITSDGNFKVHVFNSSGTFEVTTLGDIGTVEYLVIAGGGAGAHGGGGAGGYRTATGFSVSAQSYSITVGAGGAKDTTATIYGGNGSDSVFSTITSTGGGGGGSYYGNATNETGRDGGSGGGGGPSGNKPGGSGTAGQGNDGGAGMTDGVTHSSGGGGGGSSSAGIAVSSSAGGNGGNGTESSITGSAVTRAGGGGGAKDSSGSLGSGGTGGATSATYLTSVADPTVNTGSGSGGSYTGAYNANGASGVVIIRYQFQG